MKTTPEAVAVAVAERLLQPETILIAVPGPEAASLAHGLAGTALLHARLATVDPVFRAAADSHWAAAASHARRYRATNAGIFTAAGGLAASLIIGTGYLPDPAAWQASAGRAATGCHGRRSASLLTSPNAAAPETPTPGGPPTT
jgi:hypothetical protein